MFKETNAASEHKCGKNCYQVLVELLKFYSLAVHGSYWRSLLILGKRDQAVECSAYLKWQQSEYDKIARGTKNTSYSKEKRTADPQALHLDICTHKPSHRNGRRQTHARTSVLGSFANCAWVWLSDTVRIKSGTRINFSCDGTTMGHERDVAQYLSRTNASFLLGDALNSLTGCNTLVSLHLHPGPHMKVNGTKSFTYVPFHQRVFW